MDCIYIAMTDAKYLFIQTDSCWELGKKGAVADPGFCKKCGEDL